MKRKTIICKTRDGEVKVSAWLVTPELAIHPSILKVGLSKTKYAVTHVPTGRAIFHFLPGKELAQETAEKLGQIKGWDKLHTREDSDEFGIKYSKKLKAIKKFVDNYPQDKIMTPLEAK